MRKLQEKRELRRIAVTSILMAVLVSAGILTGRIISRYTSGAKVQSQVEALFYGTDMDSAVAESKGTKDCAYDGIPTSEFGTNLPEAEQSLSEPSEPEQISDPERQVFIYTKTEDIPDYDFAALLAINPDVKGWLYIPAAEIDNPVVQAEDNDYYLHRNIYGEEEYEGTFFFDHRCIWGESRNCVIYGHAMLDGSMMYKLRNLLNQETADENPAFLYITPEHVYECQIFSVYRTTIYDDYIWFQFFGDDDFLDYVEMMKNKSEVSFPDCGITSEDSILTISTCNRSLINDGTGRMAVYAKIVRIR